MVPHSSGGWESQLRSLPWPVGTLFQVHGWLSSPGTSCDEGPGLWGLCWQAHHEGLPSTEAPPPRGPAPEAPPPEAGTGG